MGTSSTWEAQVVRGSSWAFLTKNDQESGAGKDQASLVLISDDIPVVNEMHAAVWPDMGHFIR